MMHRIFFGGWNVYVIFVLGWLVPLRMCEAQEFGPGKACEVLVGGHAFFGEDASASIRAHENQACVVMYSWDKNSVLTWFRMASRPSHGLAGVYMQAGYAYKPDRNFVGLDRFSVQYKGYGKFHSGVSHVDVSVEVVP